MNTPPLPDKKYSVIYADPPWDCPARQFTRQEKITDYYSTMQIDTIRQLPIQLITENNAWLYLWVVNGMLSEGLSVMVSWGFEYKKSFIWLKGHIGMGVYNRGQHEQLLVGKRCKPSMPKWKDLQGSVVECKRGKHSVKPYHFRTIIEKQHPNTSKIELFARPNILEIDNDNGWDYWGNEV